MNRLTAISLALISDIILTSTARAAETHRISDIEQAAYEFMLEQTQVRYKNPRVSLGSLDKRLRLRACESSLEPFVNNRDKLVGKLTVGIRCHEPVSWTVYVPVEVSVLQSVVVAAKALSDEQILTADDVEVHQVDIGQLRRGHYNEEELVLGQQIRYPVAKGDVIEDRNIRPQTIVHRGQTVTILATNGGIQIRVKGKALADASKGQRVRVENISSERVVTGVAESPGVVKVTM
jgi:flagella basal body P-ring formation protein FlgA